MKEATMNKELKEQMHKEFDKKFPSLEEVTDWDMEESINKKRAVKSFIDSLIDKTVQMIEERIVGIAKQRKNFITLHSQYAIMEFVNYRKLDEKMATEIQDCIIDIVDDAFNPLITNKSNINNNK